jgi:hypothetical protein
LNGFEASIRIDGEIEGCSKHINSEETMVAGFLAKHSLETLLVGATVMFGLTAVEPLHGQIFVETTQGRNGTVAEYSNSGGLINSSFISTSGNYGLRGIAADGNGNLLVVTALTIPPSLGWFGQYSLSGKRIGSGPANGMSYPGSIAVDGNGHVFVANTTSGTIGEYTLSGDVVNASLISGLGDPIALAIDKDGRLFVASKDSSLSSTGKVGEYTTWGYTVNPSLISGINQPSDIALDADGNIYVSSSGNGTVGKYSISGVPANTSLISGLSSPSSLAFNGNGNLLVLNSGSGSIGEYTTSGDVVNPSLISGLGTAIGMDVVVPEPSLFCLVGLAGFVFALPRHLRA